MAGGAASASAPFALPGTRPLGCLLVHGFTATPAEMRSLGEALAAAGFPVHAVRLAGHGTSVDDLATTTWHDWFGSVADGAERLAREVPRVAVAGLSLGALLALHLAASPSARIAALVLCAPALRAGDRRVRWLPWLRLLPGFTRRHARIRKRGRDIADPVARAASIAYDTMPLRAVLQMMQLQRVVRCELDRVTQPTLLLHGRHDHAVPLASSEEVRRGLGAGWVEAHVLEHSWHVLTEDVERARVAALAIDFLGRVEAAASRAPA